MYRQRAHCNPLTEGGFTPPVRPQDVRWADDFPQLYADAAETKTVPPKVDFVDIGCGFGGMTVTLGKEFPDKLTVGMEIRSKVSQYVKDRIASLRVKHPGEYGNCSCIWTNTMKFLVQYFEKGSLEKMLFLFPDPQFKASKHRRRIIQTALLDEYAYLMKKGGVLYTITDVEDLADWMRDKLENHSLFVALTEEEMAADPVVGMIQTQTEEGQKVRRNGGQMFKAVFRRV
jgi:tRNA (guanine-N7-)-methyltransferase